jgi:AraC family transcriptional regulator
LTGGRARTKTAKVKPLADVHVLFGSPIGRVLDFRCKDPDTGTPQYEYQPRYGVVFTRSGAYECRVGREVACVHSGLLLLDNAGTERVVKHYGELRDQCTDIEFEPALFEANEMGRAMRFSRLTLRATPQLEALHQLIIEASTGAAALPTLHVDLLLVDLLRVIQWTLHSTPDNQLRLDRKSREYYLGSIDRAKNFMRSRFREDISLAAIARVAGISPFHFSRVFKAFTGSAPHRYLVQLRLEHAGTFLRNTRLSVTEICFDSGFASLEHFLAMFRQRFGCTPRQYRTMSTTALMRR